MTGSARRYAVIQWGARLQYAVPSILEEAGLLQTLYTDAHGDTTLSRLLKRWWPPGWRPGPVDRVVTRTIPPNIPASKIRATSWVTLEPWVVELVAPRRATSAQFFYNHRIGSQRLAARLVAQQFESADALYAHACAATVAVEAARRRGLWIALEAISMPFNKQLEFEEYGRFRRSPPYQPHDVRGNIEFFRKETRYADVVLAASPHVRKGLVDLGVSDDRIRVVPYGVHPHWFEAEPKPVRGRVLFVGNVGYLKGIPYLVQAAGELRRRGVRCDVRVVGGEQEPGIRDRAEFQGVTYVGQVPHSLIRTEYQHADIFVFPTVSDGFGLAVLEAMASGVPVVCTTNCADIVEDGVSGFVVAPRDARALADRIEMLLRNRGLRDGMAAAARLRASGYDLTNYRARLLNALRPRTTGETDGNTPSQDRGVEP